MLAIRAPTNPVILSPTPLSVHSHWSDPHPPLVYHRVCPVEHQCRRSTHEAFVADPPRPLLIGGHERPPPERTIGRLARAARSRESSDIAARERHNLKGRHDDRPEMTAPATTTTERPSPSLI